MANVNDLLDIARADLGYKESPANSNRTKYGEWYGLNGQPWCMMAVQYWFFKAGIKLPIRTASCGALMRAAQSAGCWVTKGYQPGDVVIYDFPGGAATDHCGIVESASGATVVAIEGNTAVGNDSDGGEVMRRTRNIYQIVGAWRPKEDTMTFEQWKEMMEQYRKELQDNDSGSWSAADRTWAIDNGLITGSGTLPDGQPNYMWQDQLTREQKVVMDHRLYDLIMRDVKAMLGK